MKIAPSILAADFLNLGKDAEDVNLYGDVFHLDVMDGTLVPNISFGFPVIDAIASKARKPLDVHLMIVHPEKYIERFAKSGATYISFHLEAAEQDGSDPAKILKSIKDLGVKAGLAINPDIPVEKVFPYIKDADFILIMSVFAGFGGQKFIEDSFRRVSALKAEITRQEANCEIEVDGGVSAANSKQLEACGASLLVAGSSVFKAADRKAAIESMK